MVTVWTIRIGHLHNLIALYADDTILFQIFDNAAR